MQNFVGKELRAHAGLAKSVGDDPLLQEKRAQEVSYEERLAIVEERASAVAGTAEARFQTKLLVEVDRYQVSRRLAMPVEEEQNNRQYNGKVG